jgi:hypothetical protein
LVSFYDLYLGLLWRAATEEEGKLAAVGVLLAAGIHELPPGGESPAGCGDQR